MLTSLLKDQRRSQLNPLPLKINDFEPNTVKSEFGIVRTPNNAFDDQFKTERFAARRLGGHRGGGHTVSGEWR
ncbi:hypothetical protein L596_017177 [Steinernema carpocapsae]|uniref:Uncharacterized protein n=1 Tax=Steinernema carpocapsae TaxID=34508 RepID=A0A4U5N145_STECR|nr:hypothetical protein L596_017177 [Steinernema carpocapsae]